MIPMKTLTMGGKKYEIIDEQARSNIANQREDIRRSCATAIVYKEKGHIITLNDSSDNQLLGMRVFGNSTQLSTTGAQLFDKSTAVSGMLETDGNVITDGAYVTSDFIPVTPSTAYFQTEKNSIRGKFYDVDKNPLTTEWDMQIATAGTFTTPADAYYFRTTIGAALADGYMLNAGSTSLPYESYSGGMASPCIDYPQDIVSSVNPTINVLGKNLFNFDGIEERDTIERLPDGTISVSTYYNQTSITLRELAPALSVGMECVLHIDTDGAASIYLSKYAKVWDDGYTFTMTDDILDSTVCIYGRYEQTDGSAIIRSIQIVPSGVSSEYEPYVTPQTVTISTPDQLSGIPKIYDEVDFERGVYIKKVATETITGIQFDSEDDSGRFIANSAFNNYYKAGGTQCFCNIAKWSSNSMDDRSCCVAAHAFYYKDDSKTIDEINAIFADLTVTILGALVAPVEIPLSDEELASYKQLYTKYPNTTIINNCGIQMEIEYNADTIVGLTRPTKPTEAEIQAAVKAYVDDAGIEVIVGVDGIDGYTPKKGVDYYTEAEKQELIDTILQSFPMAENSEF